MMMQNLSLVELENESLRAHFADLRKNARLLALEVKRNCAPGKNRVEMFRLVDEILRTTKK